MTKEELIALSDLNREDNIKYISSEAQGIAISLDSDRYAPTLCKLERAYICGRRKSEERIEQLERENAELKEELKAIDKAGEHVRQQINDAFRNKRPYWELEKENAELRYQLNKNPCVCNTEWHCNDCLDQLTKAKRIIKKLCEAIHKWDYKNFEEVEREAEQFFKVLKGCEVEK